MAINVSVRAQALRWEVVIASSIASFEKNPARKGVPIRTTFPMVK